jgi:hypothetical protein
LFWRITSASEVILRKSEPLTFKPVLPERVEHWPIDRFIPFATNLRTHSEAQIAQIAASIREFGFTNPILVDSEAGIIAGHARLLAARKLTLREVPVIVLDHLTERQRRAYMIGDNKLALNAGWDEDLLRLELAALRDEEFGLDVLGFEDRQSDPWYGDKSQSTLWQENKPAANRLHPTMKPVELIERALVNSSKAGDIVVDLFGGAGSTMIGCERKGRKARLMEIDPKYVDCTVRRWQEYTGQAALLEGEERSFEEVSRGRLPKAA